MEQKLLIYNTLTRTKERFTPLHAPNVGMYVCGPTVYGDPHLGHARPAITFDILFRYLKHLGYKVRYVRNITDVGHLEHDADEGDDKIEKKARLEQLEPMEIAQYYTNRYHDAMEALKALGYNMISGTAEALIYDSLKMAGREKDYIKVDANASICMKIATALGSLASLLAGVLRYAGYYLADAVSALLSALAAARLEEPIVTDEQAARERHALRELPARLRVHILDSADCLRGSALARRLIAADAVISLPSYLTSMFVQQRLTEQGGAMEWLFLPGLLAGAAGMAGTALGRRLHPRTLRGLYLACALTIGAGALLAGAAPAWACAVGPMLVQGALAVWFLHSMQRMNESISSDRRATLISVDSMTYSLLMIPASPMLGWLGDAAGSAGVGPCLLGAMVAASGLAVAAKTRYNRRGA